jgi:hypothetical protein
MELKNLSKTTSSLPDPLASNEEKLTLEYGLKITSAIQGEWFNGGMIDDKVLFTNRHNWIREMRLHNRGEQDVKIYKDHIARQTDDLTYLNLDWTPINIPEKFTNIVRNGMGDEFYRVEIRSADKFSMIEQKKKINKHKANMASKQMLAKAKEIFGVDVTEKGFVPEDEEEMELYNTIKERPRHEIAEEIMIDFVKKTNKWDYIRKETIKDSVLTDMQVGRVYTDMNNGVMVEYVDPESFGHSYVERNDFSDAYYFFYVDTLTINDIRRESGYDDKTCREIAKLYGVQNKGSEFSTKYDSCPIEDILNYRIHVMRFSYKSDKEIVNKAFYDKKGKLRKVSKKSSNYVVPEGSEKSRLSKRLDTWYEGSYIVGSNKYIYDYKESEILAKDEMNKVMPQFIVQSTNIYKNELRSFLSNIIPITNDMQYTHLKIQHLRAELKPDLIELDLDQLAELGTDVKGPVKKEVWKEALSVLNVKGVVIKKRVDMGEGGIKDSPAARPMANQQGSALTALLHIWAHSYNLVRDITGINPARDGTANQNTLVGVNQMLELASNTATKHLVDAGIAWDKRVCETISARIKGIFKVKGLEHLKPMYEQAVGKHNIEPLEVLKNRSIHEFAMTVEILPAKEELDELKQDLGIALQEGTIDVSEKAEVMRIARSNPKQASQYMRFIRTRRIKERLKENEYNIKLQGQVNTQAAQAKVEAELKSYQAKKGIDLQFAAKMSGIAMMELQQKQQIEAPKEYKEFQQDVYLKQLEGMQSLGKLQFQKDEKDDRLKEAGTIQGELIDQRQNKKAPKDFKNNFDMNTLFNQ